jgi:sugar lactone lactonase YvrE
MATTLRSWAIDTLAGNGDPGYAGDGESALYAGLNEPKGLAIDAQGNVYIADSENHVIRRLDRASGLITTVAGEAGEEGEGEAGPPPRETPSTDEDPFADMSQAATHKYTQQADLSGTVRYLINGAAVQKRFSGDGGPAVHARLNFPTAVAIDQRGTLFIADTMNHRVRRVDAITGILTTLAGTGQPRCSGDGGPADQAAINEPAALALDGQGRLFIADQSNNRVRVVDLSTGLISTYAGTGTATYDGDGMPASSASLSGPSGVVVRDGVLYIADTFNNRIRAVDLSTGIISTVAGDGGEYRFQSPSEPPSTNLSRPTGLAIDLSGDLFLTDSDSHLVRCCDHATKRIVRVAGTGVASYGGDGGAALNAGLSYPFGIVVDASGSLLVADTFNHRIRRLSLEQERS